MLPSAERGQCDPAPLNGLCVVLPQQSTEQSLDASFGVPCTTSSFNSGLKCRSGPVCRLFVQVARRALEPERPRPAAACLLFISLVRALFPVRGFSRHGHDQERRGKCCESSSRSTGAPPTPPPPPPRPPDRRAATTGATMTHPAAHLQSYSACCAAAAGQGAPEEAAIPRQSTQQPSERRPLSCPVLTGGRRLVRKATIQGHDASMNRPKLPGHIWSTSRRPVLTCLLACQGRLHTARTANLRAFSLKDSKKAIVSCRATVAPSLLRCRSVVSQGSSVPGAVCQRRQRDRDGRPDGAVRRRWVRLRRAADPALAAVPGQADDRLRAPRQGAPTFGAWPCRQADRRGPDDVHAKPGVRDPLTA